MKPDTNTVRTSYNMSWIHCISVHVGFYFGVTASCGASAAILPTGCWHVCSSSRQWEISSVSELHDISWPGRFFPHSAAHNYSLNVMMWRQKEHLMTEQEECVCWSADSCCQSPPCDWLNLLVLQVPPVFVPELLLQSIVGSVFMLTWMCFRWEPVSCQLMCSWRVCGSVPVLCLPL